MDVYELTRIMLFDRRFLFYVSQALGRTWNKVEQGVRDSYEHSC